ncbi:hypothetical protein L9F63_008238, partial [Diploptera punctata]
WVSLRRVDGHMERLPKIRFIHKYRYTTLEIVKAKVVTVKVGEGKSLSRR